MTFARVLKNFLHVMIWRYCIKDFLQSFDTAKDEQQYNLQKGAGKQDIFQPNHFLLSLVSVVVSLLILISL